MQKILCRRHPSAVGAPPWKFLRFLGVQITDLLEKNVWGNKDPAKMTHTILALIKRVLAVKCIFTIPQLYSIRTILIHTRDMHSGT